MKITFVTPSMGFGGAERVMALLANSWLDKGFQVDFIILNDEQKIAYTLKEEIGVYFMRSPRFNRMGNFRKLFFKLRRLIKQSNPDVIISFFSSTLVFSWLALLNKRTPLIYSERNDPNNNINGLTAKAFQFVALHCSNRLVFQTVGARDYYGKGIRKKGKIILNPFDPENLPTAPVDKTKTLVSVGRLCSQKNQVMQLRAFHRIAEKYPDYKLEIYGEGPLRGELQSQIDAYGLQNRIELKGACPDVLERINSAEIFLFSSWYEGLPNAVIEGMALGLPCVCTKCSPGGAEALIENRKNGILVEVDNDEQMAQEIMWLIENPVQRENIAMHAKQIIQRLDVHGISEQWLDIIQSVI